MKAILISIQPKWCELIADGRKTIEVRKTRPKIETPFKCYIYCTKNKTIADEYWGNRNGHIYIDNGKVIGEFVCDEIYVRPANVIYYGKGQEDYLDLLKSACMTEREVLDYMGGQFNRETYFWHVTDLKIYDKPKELSDFSKYEYKYLGGCCVNNNCKNYIYNGYYQPPECKIDGCFFKRPPQSWCYVKELL